MKDIVTYKRNILPLLFFIIFNLSFITAHATVRYVSHNGSNTPPYTSWETAADSIMSAINISVFDDTIYVASGVYKEQVIMIPGLTLSGAGMDSTIIDTRTLVQPSGFFAVTDSGNSVIEGFQIIVSSEEVGFGIEENNVNTIVRFNRIKNVVTGIRCHNSNSHSYKNIITDAGTGFLVSSFYDYHTPLIENNLIYADGFGIQIEFGTKPTIRNNIIYLDGDLSKGYRGGESDSVWLYNNLVISSNSDMAFHNTIVPTTMFNNTAIGEFTSYAVRVENFNKVINNNVFNSSKGIWHYEGSEAVIKYNNSWNNGMNYLNFTPDTTNLSVDPMVVNADTTQGDLDFHLQKYSPLINAGDPNILDRDITRSDIGLYGGPFGESYQYLDLAPKPPRNLSAVVDSEYITIFWNKNTEADFNSYNLYRDTTSNFTADTTTFVVNLTDTSYQQIIPQGTDAFYYKLRAIDNQGNISQPSEELPVIITSVEEYPVTVSNYQLYQNYPNPFNPSTKIGYKLKERGYVKLMVYDIKGELVSVLVNQTQDAGYHEVEFNAGGSTAAVGRGFKPVLASGIYIYQIMVKNGNNIPVFTDMKKMLMIK